jgi:hypothetical protein
MRKSSNRRILHAFALTMMTGGAVLSAAAWLSPGSERPVTLLGNSRKTGALGSTPPAPSARIEVHAPFAQQLIVAIKAEHPEIQKLGLHAVPPGQTQSAIIANNYPEKIGKLSTPGDLKTVASGEPKAHRIDKGKFWDTFIPLHDEHRKVIGFLVMEVPFNTAPTEEGAIAEGIKIRDEVQRQVPTLGKLFEPAK